MTWYFPLERIVGFAEVTALQERFKFGKWKKGETEYAGRRIRQEEGRILVDMETYVLEQIHPVNLPKSRSSDEEAMLTPEEIKTYRCVCMKIQWVAREVRPDLAGAASLLNSALPSPTVGDYKVAMKVARYTRSTANVTLKLWALDLHNIAFVTVSDAGGPGSARREGSQGAWVLLAAEGQIRTNRELELYPSRGDPLVLSELWQVLWPPRPSHYRRL